MAEVPEIVRERLHRQAIAGEHPDANLLSAFAEHALTEQERVLVLDHLSRCAECREILALSAPQLGEERRVAPAAAPSQPDIISWWRSPVVHWGALTAAALVVLVAVGARLRLREGHSASAPAVARYEPAPESTATREGTILSAEPKQSPNPVKETPQHAKALHHPEAPGGASAGKLAIVGGSSPSAGAANAPIAPAELPLPRKAKQFDVLNTAPSPSPEAIEQAQAKAAPAPSTSETISMEAAAPAVSNPQRQRAMLSARSGAIVAKRASLTARWSVTSTGALQRSLNGGRTWNEIAVADSVTFRAVATVRQDVWAGGSRGALYHSSDGGEHWSQVLVRANDRPLSGDVVRIDFADAKNGVVSTSTGETWSTSDNGRTWKLH